MQKNSQYKLGLFVCLTIALLIIILIFLGSMDRFYTKGHLITFLSESVQGLTPGSEVKYQGVPVGVVEDITIEMESRLIRVDMEINLSKIRIPDVERSGKYVSISRELFCQRLEEGVQKKGLRCKLEAAGITGMKYIELDYVENAGKTITLPPGLMDDTDAFYIPSVPSLLNDLRTSVVGILEKLEALDYQGLMQKTEQTLAYADKLLTDPKIDSILLKLDKASGELEGTMTGLRKTLTPERVQELLQHSQSTMTAVRQLSDILEKELKDAELKQLSGKGQRTLDSLRSTSVQFKETMSRIDSAVDALTELIQMLDNDPSALLHGKKNAAPKQKK